jgi:hypothetical protein
VRDICRKDPEVRETYGRAKLELSKREWESVDEYCEAKTDILTWVLEKAGASSEEREQVKQLNTVGINVLCRHDDCLHSHHQF